MELSIPKGWKRGEPLIIFNSIVRDPKRIYVRLCWKMPLNVLASSAGPDDVFAFYSDHFDEVAVFIIWWYQS